MTKFFFILLGVMAFSMAHAENRTKDINVSACNSTHHDRALGAAEDTKEKAIAKCDRYGLYSTLPLSMEVIYDSGDTVCVKAHYRCYR